MEVFVDILFKINVIFVGNLIGPNFTDFFSSIAEDKVSLSFGSAAASDSTMFSLNPTAAAGISTADSLSPITAFLHYDNAIRNCFGVLLDGHQNARQIVNSSVTANFGFFLVRPFPSNENDSSIVMQIFFADKPFQPFLLTSTLQPILALNASFSSANKLRDGETVLLHPLPENALNCCESVTISPLDNDDWNNIISAAEQVEELLLGQLRVIQSKMCICIHLNDGKSANFSIGEILPHIPSSICNGNDGTSALLSHPPAFLMVVGTRVIVSAPPYSADGNAGGDGEEKRGQKESKRREHFSKRTFLGTDSDGFFDCFCPTVDFADFCVTSRVFSCPVSDFLPFSPSSSSSLNPFFAAHRRLCLLLNTLPFVFVPHGTLIKRKELHEIGKCCVCVQFDDGEGGGEGSQLAEAVLVELPQAEQQMTTTPLGSFCDRLSLLIERFGHSSAGLRHCWLSPSLHRLCRRSLHLRWIRIRPIASADQCKSITNLVVCPTNCDQSAEEAKQTFMDLVECSRELYTPWLFPSDKCHWNLRLIKTESADGLMNFTKSEEQFCVKLMDGGEEKTDENANNQRVNHRLLWPLSSEMVFQFKKDEEKCRHPTNECHSENTEQIETTTPSHKCVKMIGFSAQQSVLSSLSHSIHTVVVVNTKVQNLWGEAAVPLALFLEGPCGSGKSILLEELLSKLQTNCEFVPIAAEIVDCSAAGNFLRRFVDSVDSVMADLVKLWPSALFLDNFDAFIEKFSVGGDQSAEFQNEQLTKRIIYQTMFNMLFGEICRRKVPIVCAISDGSKVPEDILELEGMPLKWEMHRIGPIDKDTQKNLLNKMLAREGDATERIVQIESANFETIGELNRLVEKLEFRISAANRMPSVVTRFDSEDIRSVASICKRHEFGEGELAIRFDKIAGLESIKRKLVQIFLWPAKYPTLFSLSSAVRVGHRAILHGPSGCGKSMLLRALAGEMDANVFSVRGPQLLSKYIGQSEQNVRQLFAKAKASKPALIIFDEIDAIAPQRGSDNAHVTDRMVNQMLTELDGFEGDTDGVFVIAVTNRIDLVDKALLRPGRFDFKLRIGLPNFELRLAILRLYCTTEWGIHLSDNVNLKLIAQQTGGFSGAEMRSVVQNALYESEGEHLEKDGKFENRTPRVCQKHFNRAIEHMGKKRGQSATEEKGEEEATILKQRLTFNS